MSRKTDQPVDTPETTADAVELGEGELNTVTGGGTLKGATQAAQLGSWKMASMDGKGNDVLTEELTLVKKKARFKPG